MKKHAGFTLIELMVVMAIIAILATAGLSAYSGYIKKGRDTARVQIAQSVNTAVVGYMASHKGVPPKDATELSNFIAASADVFTGSSVDAANSTLIQDPVGGKDVCLDAEDGTTEPCAFHYTAYSDGTYAISYGIESPASRETNFYKTTSSTTGPSATKYGVYIGTAPFIGNLAAADNDVTPADTGLTVSLASARIDVPVVSGGASNSVCDPVCGGFETCVSNTCVDICDGKNIGEVCVGGGIFAGMGGGEKYMITPLETTADWATGQTVCASLGQGGYWWLPSFSQLQDILYPNRGQLPFSSGLYWSQSEYYSLQARCKSFDPGNTTDICDKTDQLNVRCFTKYAFGNEPG